MKNELIEDINELMLETFAEDDISDTPENRLDFLQGLRNIWDELPAEDEEEKSAKALYKMALLTEIINQRAKWLYQKGRA